MRNVLINYRHELIESYKNNILVKTAYKICKIFNADSSRMNAYNAVEVNFNIIIDASDAVFKIFGTF